MRNWLPQARNGVEKLGMERLGELLSSDLPSRFEALTQQDEDAAGHLKTLTDVERLVLYHHHLHRLLMNFVSFCDFYALSRPTTFQIGTLFIDGRGCNLCLRVDDITNHAAQAQPRPSLPCLLRVLTPRHGPKDEYRRGGYGG